MLQPGSNTVVLSPHQKLLVLVAALMLVLVVYNLCTALYSTRRMIHSTTTRVLLFRRPS
jgi:hypothetical protein